ncbi:ABC transporter substrate-binding protein [Streptomyces sp. uw30]|uniref:ABC transporter substrate-binding protein n=1 Tax=Streptomyces sp. uw30 TaxID=1828179 RepID=UPI002905B98E|nr:ABC transporter substrate-binding protein [Streptomyces sp. uw30]
MPAFAQAYARWINAHGGIDGRKLKVLTCNDHNDSVAAAKCADRAVEENVVAVVGSYSQYGDTFLPSLEGAGIPYIGGYGVTNAEFTSPLSYPVNGGQPTLLAGLGKELARDCGPVALVRPDTIAGDELPPLLNSGLRAGGHSTSDDQLADEDATAYDSQSERALNYSTTDSSDQGCVVPALGDRTSTFMDSFRRARDEYPGVRTATVLGSVDQTVINATGGGTVYDGSYITGWYPVASDPRWDGLKKVISEQAFGDNRIDPADAGVQTTWIAYTVFKRVVESLGDGDVTADSVRGALNGGLKVSTGGLTPTLQYADACHALVSAVVSSAWFGSWSTVSLDRSVTSWLRCRAASRRSWAALPRLSQDFTSPTALITAVRLSPLSASSLSRAVACCSAGSAEGEEDSSFAGAVAATGRLSSLLSSPPPPASSAPAPMPRTAIPTPTAAMSGSRDPVRPPRPPRPSSSSLRPCPPGGKNAGSCGFCCCGWGCWKRGRCWVAPAGAAPAGSLRKRLSKSESGCRCPPPGWSVTGGMYCVASASLPAVGGIGPAPPACRARPSTWVLSLDTSGGSAPGPTGGMYCVAPSSAAGAATGGM